MGFRCLRRKSKEEIERHGIVEEKERAFKLFIIAPIMGVMTGVHPNKDKNDKPNLDLAEFFGRRNKKLCGFFIYFRFYEKFYFWSSVFSQTP